MISKNLTKWHFPPYESDKKRLQEAAVNLFKELPSRKAVKKAILEGKIYVNSQPAFTSTWVKLGDKIELDFEEFQIGLISEFKGLLYDDKYLCILLKNAGIITSGNHKNTLETQLLNHLINSNITKKHTTTGAAHRIDKDTHGPVIFYKDKLTAKCLGEMFENHEIHKEYFALVHGIFEPEKCSVKIPISGKESQTEFEKISTTKLPYIGPVTFIKATPISGRKHQIRIHCKSLGHQIVGDKIHKGEKVYTGSGMFLACSNLRFNHPITNREISITTPLPRKFHKLPIKL